MNDEGQSNEPSSPSASPSKRPVCNVYESTSCFTRTPHHAVAEAMNPALVGPALVDDERARDQKPTP